MMRDLKDILRDATDATLAGECIQPQAADILALCDEVEQLRATLARVDAECDRLERVGWRDLNHGDPGMASVLSGTCWAQGANDAAAAIRAAMEAKP